MMKMLLKIIKPITSSIGVLTYTYVTISNLTVLIRGPDTKEHSNSWIDKELTTPWKKKTKKT